MFISFPARVEHMLVVLELKTDSASEQHDTGVPSQCITGVDVRRIVP